MVGSAGLSSQDSAHEHLGWEREGAFAVVTEYMCESPSWSEVRENSQVLRKLQKIGRVNKWHCSKLLQAA